MRSFSDTDAASLKAATASAYEAMGGVSKAAAFLGVGSSTLTKYASVAPEWRESFIRADLAIRLDRATGNPYLLNAITHMVGTAPRATFGAVTAAAVLRLDRALDDVVRAVVDAMEDSHIDAAERAVIRKAIVVAKELLGRLDALMVGGG